MPDYPYNVEIYTSLLTSEMTKLIIIAIVLALIFTFVIVYSALQIKEDKYKKIPYIQLVLSVVIGVFLLFSLGSQISAFAKDISCEEYIQYVGSVDIKEERQIIFGGIPTGYTEYIISFEQNGKKVELAERKDYGLSGHVEKVYIVYAENTKFILDLVE